MTRKSRMLTPGEKALWSKVTESVSPLHSPTGGGTPIEKIVSTLEPTPKPPPERLPPVAGPTHKPSPGPRAARAAPPAPSSAPSPAKAWEPPAGLMHQALGGEGPERFGEMDRRTHQRLRQGKLGFEAKLDLHGKTQAEAHEALRAFVRAAHARGLRRLLVITGKGGGVTAGFGEKKGVLRQKLPFWLAQADLKPLVLGLESARPHHGGEGAFYVLLRRAR